MEEIFYNILWIDDEHEGLSGIKGRAKRNGINLIPFRSSNGGMSELERNYPMFDGVLFDAKILENEDDVKGTEDTIYVHRAKERVLQLKKKFEIFILTGQAEAYEDKTFKKAFTKVYMKGSDGEIDRLFIDIKKAAATQEDTQIRQCYKRVFDFCTDSYIGRDSALTFLNAIKGANNESSYDSKDYFLLIRKMLELLFEKLNKIGLIPDDIFNSNGWFNPTSDFLTGKESNYIIKSDVIHPTIAFLLRQLKDITQDAEHNIQDKLRLKTDDFITIIKTPYLFRSSLNQLCDILVWFKKFIDDHPDPVQNKNLWSVTLQDPAPGATWIPGVVSKIAENGYGTFRPNDQSDTISITPHSMKLNHLHENDKIEITTKPDPSGTKTHIDQIRIITP